MLPKRGSRAPGFKNVQEVSKGVRNVFQNFLKQTIVGPSHNLRHGGSPGWMSRPPSRLRLSPALTSTRPEYILCHAHDVLADVVDIPLHGGDEETSRRATAFGEFERFFIR